NQLTSKNQTNQLTSKNQTIGDILKELFNKKRKELDNEHKEYVNNLTKTVNDYKKDLFKEIHSFMDFLAGNSVNVSANKNVTVSANKNVTVSANKNVTEIEQLKEEINKLKTQIKELIAENNKLKKISPKTPQVSKHFIKGAMKKINRYITKYGKNPKTVKYGNKSLKTKEFLNLKLVKNAKKSITQFKAKKGRLPNYVDVNGVRLYKQNYRILFHI
ncbi:MAG: hypothetical protein MJ211_15355, partial [Bacteroidales bacterium]|nr:hypothetical protein [Bacteroidales bacterium]